MSDSHRRARMARRLGRGSTWVAAVIAMCVLNASAETQEGDTPIGKKWWPSRWGADDQRGAANLMNAERVLEATKLIRTGKVYHLGRVYEREMPTFPHRTFRLTI